ncbi:MAG: ABC transporter permease [Myxococcales bacterium]|nr:ABC transporter permease [Myxococcales bacterium]
MVRNLRELYQYRALLLSLTLRELKARYRGSVLGFLWTFLNPTLHMLVYALLFKVVLRQEVPHFLYFMFVGLLPWICFSTSVNGGASAISDRRDLLTKVRFPAQVLPATVVLTNLCNYFFSLPLMFALGAAYGIWPSWHAVAFVPVLALQVLFTLALTYVLSALNVAFRDLQHIVANLMMLAFFLTPVLWPLSRLPERVQQAELLANPMAALVTSYQAIFYEHRLPALEPLLAVAGISVVLLWVASAIFERRREEFAELI